MRSWKLQRWLRRRSERHFAAAFGGLLERGWEKMFGSGDLPSKKVSV